MNQPYFYVVTGHNGEIFRGNAKDAERAKDQAEKVEHLRPVRMRIEKNPYYHYDIKIEIK